MSPSMIARVVLWIPVAVGMIALVWATAFREPSDKKILREITWSELKKAGKLNDGKIQQGGPSMHHEPLKIENPTNQPKVVALIDLKDPGVTALSYGIQGSVRCDDVKGKSYLEMWSYFAGGGAYFSRTLGDAGVMRHLEGSSDWRPFLLPFFSDEKIGVPTQLVVNVVFVDRGTVELSPVTLYQLRPGWWSDQAGGWIGGIGGGIVGTLAALLGILVGFGKARGFVVTTTIIMIGLGVISLVAGFIALALGQPYAVCNPLLLMGIILTAVCGENLRGICRRYEQNELRKMAAMDAR